MEGANRAVTPQELADMLGISAKTANEHIKRHPKRIEVGLGKIRKRYRLPYDEALRIITGDEPLPKSAPRRVMPRESVPRCKTRAANGCNYAQKRK